MITCLLGCDAVTFARKEDFSKKFHDIMSQKLWHFSSILLINLTPKCITKARVKSAKIMRLKKFYEFKESFDNRIINVQHCAVATQNLVTCSTRVSALIQTITTFSQSFTARLTLQPRIFHLPDIRIFLLKVTRITGIVDV
jgi:hypothetical protein